MYLSLMGKQGLVGSRPALRRPRGLCAQAAEEHRRRPARRSPSRYFNEFAVTLPRDASDVVSALIDQGIAAGFPVGRYYKGMENVLLLAFTEKRTKEEIDVLAAKLESVL